MALAKWACKLTVMRIVFGIGSRLYFWETTLKKAVVRGSSDAGEDDETEEFAAAPPQDPHGTLSAHCEISPSAVMDGANARRFGFGGG